MVPDWPTGAIDLADGSVVVTVRGRMTRVASYDAALGVVAAAASGLGRPVRVWLRRPGGVADLAAVAPGGELVGLDVPVPVEAGSPIPADALRGSRGSPGERRAVEIPQPAQAAPLSLEEIGAQSGRRSGWWSRGRRPSATEDPLARLTGLTYMVANKKGGSGKTPLAVLLAAAFAQARPRDSVLVDINPVGNLALRAGLPPNVPTAGDLAVWLASLSRMPYEPQLFAGSALLAPGGWRAIPSRTSLVAAVTDQSSTLAAALTKGQVELLLAALGLVTPIIGMDAGNSHRDEAWLAGAARADVLVVPVRMTPDTCQAAGEMLDDMVKLGFERLVRRAIIVETRGPGDPVDRGRARAYRRYFTERGWQVLSLPPDPHLTGRAAIEWDRLKPATRTAATRIAQAVAQTKLGAS